jgi:hypothetical protein
MDEKSNLNKKIDDLVEDLDQSQKDEIYRSLSKIIDVINEMRSQGSTSKPILPGPTGTTFKCPKCGKDISVS